MSNLKPCPQCCAECEYYRCHFIMGEGDCKNADSPYYKDWVSSEHYCEDFKNAEESKTQKKIKAWNRRVN